MEPIRIAQIIGKWLGGGVEAVVMNYYRNIDRTKIQFDFICDEDSTDIPYEEIESLGGKVILIPPYQKVFKYQKELKKVLKENNYKIVHSHINTLSVFPLYAAKKVGIPVRIAHSHSTIINSKAEFKRNILKNILKHFSKLYATDYFACSLDAGVSQFGKKSESEIVIFNNGINVDNFKFNKKVRDELRKRHGIDSNSVVIGNAGRMVKTKNQKFLIEIFNEYYKLNPDSYLVIAGQGPLENDLYNLSENLNIKENVIFLGQIDNLNNYYSMFDLFVLPSLYEGLGLVLIEAQCSGCKCFASNTVPILANVSGELKYIELNNSALEWAKSIYNETKDVNRINCVNMIKSKGFCIEDVVARLEKKYSSLIEWVDNND